MSANHNSKTCNSKAPGHKVEATNDNTMGGNLANKPTSKWWSTPAGEINNNYNLINSLLSTNTPGCVHNFLKYITALLDSAASLSLLHQDTPATMAPQQQPPKMLTIPNGQTLATTKTMCLQLTNLPQLATTAYCAPNIHNNLLAVSELCDAGNEVTFEKDGMVIQSNGVIV